MAHKKSKKVVKKIKAPKKPTMQELCPVKPLTQKEGDMFKLSVNLGNAYKAVMDDISQKELAISQMKSIGKQIKDGDIKGPLMQQIAPGVYGQFHDMKDTVKKINLQINQVELTIKIAMGQLPHRHDEYVDSLILFRDKLTEKIGDAKLSAISDRRAVVGKGKETALFEQSFEDFKNKCSCKDCADKKSKK